MHSKAKSLSSIDLRIERNKSLFIKLQIIQTQNYLCSSLKIRRRKETIPTKNESNSILLGIFSFELESYFKFNVQIKLFLNYMIKSKLHIS